MGDEQSRLATPAVPDAQDPGGIVFAQVVTALGQLPDHSLTVTEIAKILAPSVGSPADDHAQICAWLQAFDCLEVSEGEPPGARRVTLILGSPPAPHAATQVVSVGDGGQELCASSGAIVQLRGLPFRATPEDIRDFLRGHAENLMTTESAIKMVFNRDGRPSGFAQLQFTSAAAAKACREQLHKQLMGDRYVEVLPYTEKASERTGKVRNGRDDANVDGSGMFAGGDAIIEAEMRDCIIQECRDHMSMLPPDPETGRQQLLLSMLGAALSAPSRNLLRRSSLSLKHLIARYPNEFWIEGKRGGEKVVFCCAVGGCGTMSSYQAQAIAASQSAWFQATQAAFAAAAVDAYAVSDIAASGKSPPGTPGPTTSDHGNAPPTPSDWGTPGPTTFSLASQRDAAAMTTGGFGESEGTTSVVAAEALPAQSADVAAAGFPWNFPHGGPPEMSAPPWLANSGGNGYGALPWFPCGGGGSAWPPWVQPSDMFAHTRLAQEAAAAHGQKPLRASKTKGAQSESAAGRSHAHLHPQSHPFEHKPPPAKGGAQGDRPLSSGADGIATSEIIIPGAGSADEDPSASSACIRLRGLPFNMSVQDVLAFIARHEMAEGIADGEKAANLLLKANGRPSGQAVVKMRSQADADAAQKALNHKYTGGRYIEVFAYPETGAAGQDCLAGADVAVAGGADVPSSGHSTGPGMPFPPPPLPPLVSGTGLSFSNTCLVGPPPEPIIPTAGWPNLFSGTLGGTEGNATAEMVQL